MRRFMDRLRPNLEALQGLDPATRLSLIFQDFTRFAAANPELLLLMTDANKRGGSNIARVMEDQLRPAYEMLRGLIEDAQRAGVMPAGDPTLIYYSMVAVAAMLFSLHSEFELLTGRNPREPDMVEAQASLLEGLRAHSILIPARGARSVRRCNEAGNLTHQFFRD